MAEEEQGSSGGIPETVVFLVGLLVVLGALWVVRGGPKAGDIQPGIFLKPPAPLGTGEVYGPAIGAPTAPQYQYQTQSPYQNPAQPPAQYQAPPQYVPEYQYQTQPPATTPNLY